LLEISVYEARIFSKSNNCTHCFRPYLLRDAYDDMMLDCVQPVRDTFHTLIVGTMKGCRLQDALYFRDQMKEMGLQPDVRPLISLNLFYISLRFLFAFLEIILMLFIKTG